jgi:hypothetical protein
MINKINLKFFTRKVSILREISLDAIHFMFSHGKPWLAGTRTA